MIRFSCSVTGDLVMLDTHAVHLLALIGKSADSRGVITPQQMPEAIASLEAAAAEPPETGPDWVAEDEADEAEPVSLSQRAFPMLQMLRRAKAADAPILWGV